MNGKIKVLIDKIIDERSKGDELLKEMTKTKMILKGIDPRKYTSESPDDPVVINKLETLAKELNLTI